MLTKKIHFERVPLNRREFRGPHNSDLRAYFKAAEYEVHTLRFLGLRIYRTKLFRAWIKH